ncbi:unnamed protein product [Orchesella dallaii]|uniref:Methyltransferase domain-containing protein n=1 Tax=Orchesella dallaii TaxID=48710 RepID=A0ABP1RF04_9HEXA
MACQQDAEEFFPQMMKTMRWSEGEAVLDFGCGGGGSTCKYILPEVESRNGIVYGIEMSEELVSQAKERSSAVNWIGGDIMDESSFNGIKFDKIFSMHVLNYFTDVEDIKKGLTRHHQLLKPGGQIGCVSLTANTMMWEACKAVAEKRKELLSNAPARCDWTKYENGKGEETFTRLLEGCGFRVIDLRVVVNREFTIQNLNGFKDHMIGFNPYIKDVPEDLKETIKDEHRRELINLTGAAEDANKVTLRYEILYIVAEKME